MVSTLKDQWKHEELQVYISNLDAVELESEAMLDHDSKLLKIAYLTVLGYCSWALFKNSWAQCKSHLAVISCLSGMTVLCLGSEGGVVVMAIGSVYGMCQLFGVKVSHIPIEISHGVYR